ncbi:MAG: hypothetical protein LBD13_07915 [Spirochaetaceae bacterium]|jgi:hypothetical protein|nr:hypothetical protein [Spirochaetaceae bacterium]
MYYYPKWLPAERLLIVQKAGTWGGVLAVKAGSWGVPNGVVTTLHDRTNEAEDALNAAMASPRSEVLNARVRAAFERLIAAMQDIKDRYFKSPPLLEEVGRDMGGHRPPKPPIKASCAASVRHRSPLRPRFRVVTKIANPLAARST